MNILGDFQIYISVPLTMKPVYNAHLNIADTFLKSHWYSLHRDSIVVALVYTALFNKHFKMPNPL